MDGDTHMDEDGRDPIRMKELKAEDNTQQAGATRRVRTTAAVHLKKGLLKKLANRETSLTWLSDHKE